jgi:hypothetical protein
LKLKKILDTSQISQKHYSCSNEEVVAATADPVSTGDAKYDSVSICCGNANGGGEMDSSANEKIKWCGNLLLKF